MQKYIIQQMYNFVGNEGFDDKIDDLTQEIISKYGDGLTEDEKEDFLGMLMEFDRQSFESGVKSLCSFLTVNNDF